MWVAWTAVRQSNPVPWAGFYRARGPAEIRGQKVTLLIGDMPELGR
jgi:hypothetical protein